MSMIAGLLGLLMFVWGFLKWLKFGNGDGAQKYGGYAFGMPTTVVIGFSLAAGLVALFGASEHRAGRGVHSAIPTALAATALMVAVGILLGKGSISPHAGSKVGVEIGLILAIVTAAVQTLVLGAALANRHHDTDVATTTTATHGDQTIR
ncbi:MAG: DUF5336 domain-containing protein [Actinomycetota bacterium]|nr:DUF5336 domain-containing protein [Actinomycetota bacterium]